MHSQILEFTSILTVWVGDGGTQNNTYNMQTVEQGPIEEEVYSIVGCLREDGFLPA